MSKKVIEQKSWKDRMSEMIEGQEINVSIKFRDNNFGLAERITKLTKQGYFKYCGIKHGTMTWKRTNKSAENYGNKKSN